MLFVYVSQEGIKMLSTTDFSMEAAVLNSASAGNEIMLFTIISTKVSS